MVRKVLKRKRLLLVHRPLEKGAMAAEKLKASLPTFEAELNKNVPCKLIPV